MNDIEYNRCYLDYWDAIKKWLKSQFYLKNVKHITHLSFLSSINRISSRICKNLYSLYVGIQDMSKVDWLFYFQERTKEMGSNRAELATSALELRPTRDPSTKP